MNYASSSKSIQCYGVFFIKNERRICVKSEKFRARAKNDVISTKLLRRLILSTEILPMINEFRTFYSIRKEQLNRTLW